MFVAVTPSAPGLKLVVVRSAAGHCPLEFMAHAGTTVSSVVSVQAEDVIGNKYASAWEVMPLYARHPTAPADAAGAVIFSV